MAARSGIQQRQRSLAERGCLTIVVALEEPAHGVAGAGGDDLYVSGEQS